MIDSNKSLTPQVFWILKLIPLLCYILGRTSEYQALFRNVWLPLSKFYRGLHVCTMETEVYNVSIRSRFLKFFIHTYCSSTHRGSCLTSHNKHTHTEMYPAWRHAHTLQTTLSIPKFPKRWKKYIWIHTCACHHASAFAWFYLSERIWKSLVAHKAGLDKS